MRTATPHGDDDAVLALAPRRPGPRSPLFNLPVELRRELCRRIRAGDSDGAVSDWLGDSGHPASRWSVRRFRKAIEPALLRIEEARALVDLWAVDDEHAEAASSPQRPDIALATVEMLRAAAFAGAARVDAATPEGVRDLAGLALIVQRLEAADSAIAARRRPPPRGARPPRCATPARRKSRPSVRNGAELCGLVRNCAAKKTRAHAAAAPMTAGRGGSRTPCGSRSPRPRRRGGGRSARSCRGCARRGPSRSVP